MQALKSKIEEACTKGTGCSCQPLRSGILSLKNITLYYTVLHCITPKSTISHPSTFVKFTKKRNAAPFPGALPQAVPPGTGTAFRIIIK